MKKQKTRRASFFKSKNDLTLRDKTLMTILILAVVRLMASIPVPFVDRAFFHHYLEQSTVLGFLNSLSGNGLKDLSIMALSISPYITASIVMQLMEMVFPRVHEMQHGMKRERDAIRRLTLVLAGILAMVEGFFMAMNFGRNGLIVPYGRKTALVVAALWTFGSVFAVAAGELIQERYMGNGVSLILLSNILSSYLPDLRDIWAALISEHSTKWKVAITAVVALCVFLFFMYSLFILSARKDIPVHFPPQTMSAGATATKGSIPARMCPGTVLPLIFSSIILSVPALMQARANRVLEWTKYFSTDYWFKTGAWRYTLGVIPYIALIFFFSYYYEDMVFSPNEVAMDLKKQGGVIPGVRQGQETADYLKTQMKYTIGLGAGAMSILALIPIASSSLLGIGKLAFFGASVMIAAAVIQETAEDYMSQKLTGEYAKSSSLFQPDTGRASVSLRDKL